VLSEEEAADIYEMRVALEGLAAHRFIERATPQKVAELRAAFEGYVAAAPSEGDNLDRLRAKDAFYKVLFEGAASEPLTQMLTMLQSRVRLLRWTSLSVPGRAEETIEEMRAVVDAIEAKDPEAAASACARHVRKAAATALARIAESPDPLADEG
jgi:DNA-binding GntR family transcriptional regulator